MNTTKVTVYACADAPESDIKEAWGDEAEFIDDGCWHINISVEQWNELKLHGYLEWTDEHGIEWFMEYDR